MNIMTVFTSPLIPRAEAKETRVSISPLNLIIFTNVKLINMQVIPRLLLAGIRHPEELSFCKPLEPNHLKYNLKDLPTKKKVEHQKNGHWNVPADTNTFIPASQSPRGSTGSLDQSSPFMCAPVTPNNRNHSTPISSPVSVNLSYKRDLS